MTEKTERNNRRTAMRGLGLATVIAAVAPMVATLPSASAASFPTSGSATTTGMVNFRTGPSTHYKIIRALAKNTKVTINGTTKNGYWEPVVISGIHGWISGYYLHALPKAPVSSPKTPTPDPTPPANATGTGYASIPAAVHFYGPSGITEQGKIITALVHQQFPQVESIGGYRNEEGSDHATGHAIDVMLPGNYKLPAQRALGAAIADWAKTNEPTLKIKYVIWDQHIWAPYRATEGWRLMEDRGSDTANHKDHVHISYY